MVKDQRPYPFSTEQGRWTLGLEREWDTYTPDNHKPQSQSFFQPRNTSREPNHQLMNALRRGDAAEVLKLLESGPTVDINLPDKSGFTPLVMTITNAHLLGLTVIEGIVKAGADCNCPGFFPLRRLLTLSYVYWFVVDRKDTLTILLKRIQNRQLQIGVPPLFYCLFLPGDGGTRSLELLLRNGATASCKFGALQRQPLHIVASLGGRLQSERQQKLVIESLIHFGADINAADLHGNTPLMYAARALCPRTFKLLLEDFGASIEKDGPFNSCGFSVLHMAVIQLSGLRERRRDISSDGTIDGGYGHHLIHQSLGLRFDARGYDRCTKIVEAAIQAGSDINHMDRGGNTVLHHAFSFLDTCVKVNKKRMKSFIAFLIEVGADESLRNSHGKLAKDLCQTDLLGIRP